jgi:hypothetical protein
VIEQQLKNAPANIVELSFFYEMGVGFRLGCGQKRLEKVK